MGIVRSIQKGEQPASKFSKDAQDAAKSMKKGSVKKYAKTKHDDLPLKKESLSKSQIKKMRDEFDKTGELPPHLKKVVKGKKEFEKKFKVKDIVIPGMEWMSKLGEERDYKDEYKKFQSSTKSKKYRAELNKYNRKKGTYGNGDGKDASHKGGKIVGFEKESKNRGRAEKSRLKKEGVITENPAAIAAGVRAAMARAKEKELSAGGGKKVKVSTALANKSHPKHKQAKGIIQRIKDKAKSMLAKSKKKKVEPKKQSKSDANFYARQFGGTSESINENDKVKVLKLLIKRGNNPKDAKKDVEKLYNKVSKIYKNASNSKKAEIISTLSAKMKSKNEGFGGDLKGTQKKKFEKARKENAEQLGYEVTGKSDIKESVNEANIKDIEQVLKKKSAKKIDGMYMDMTTANAIMTVYKALGQSNKKKFAKLPLKKMVSVAWKLVK